MTGQQNTTAEQTAPSENDNPRSPPISTPARDSSQCTIHKDIDGIRHRQAGTVPAGVGFDSCHEHTKGELNTVGDTQNGKGQREDDPTVKDTACGGGYGCLRQLTCCRLGGVHRTQYGGGGEIVKVEVLIQGYQRTARSWVANLTRSMHEEIKREGVFDISTTRVPWQYSPAESHPSHQECANYGQYGRFFQSQNLCSGHMRHAAVRLGQPPDTAPRHRIL